MTLPRGEIEEIDLVERIARLALALKNQRLAIGRKIALPAPFTLESQLPDVRQEAAFAGWRNARSRPSVQAQKAEQ